jgi:hypothetical protein
LLEVAATLDRVGIEYLLGGSLASSVLGEPRSTVDIDLAVHLREPQLRDFVREIEPAFFVDEIAAREAVRRRASFNILHRETMLKVDIFVLGDDAFDREQMHRKVFVSPSSDSDRTIAVSSAEDLVLRKLAWYLAGGGVSDRQWRDVLGILKVQRGRIELAYLREWGTRLGLLDLVERAITEADLD